MTAPPPLTPTVALLHTLPSGAAHIDWLIAPSPAPNPPDSKCLLTLRLPTEAIGPLGPNPGRWIATLIPDHRSRYLTYEGPIGAGADGEDRGRVSRIWSGTIIDRTPAEIEMTDGQRTWIAQCTHEIAPRARGEVQCEIEFALRTP